MKLTWIFGFFLSTAFAYASPVTPVLGDWDLGRDAAALRIREIPGAGDRIELLYCNRDRLIRTGKCPTDIQIELTWSESEGAFVHDSLAQKGLKAWIFAQDGTRITYRHLSSWASGERVGVRFSRL